MFSVPYSLVFSIIQKRFGLSRAQSKSQISFFSYCFVPALDWTPKLQVVRLPEASNMANRVPSLLRKILLGGSSPLQKIGCYRICCKVVISPKNNDLLQRQAWYEANLREAWNTHVEHQSHDKRPKLTLLHQHIRRDP